MNKYVADTQVLVKHLLGIKSIEKEVKFIFEKADRGEVLIIVPAPTLFEIAYLSRKGRFDISFDRLDELFNSGGGYQALALNFEMIKTAFEITDIPELHDKLISGVARHLKVPVLTNDPVIIASQFVKTV